MESGIQQNLLGQWFAFGLVQTAIWAISIFRSLLSIVRRPTMESATHSSRSHFRDVYQCIYVLVLTHSYLSSLYCGYVAAILIDILFKPPYPKIFGGTTTLIIELTCDRLIPIITRSWNLAANDKLPLKLLRIYPVFAGVLFLIIREVKKQLKWKVRYDVLFSINRNFQPFRPSSATDKTPIHRKDTTTKRRHNQIITKKEKKMKMKHNQTSLVHRVSVQVR